MKKLFLIATREWQHFFQTPFAMILLTIYLVLCGTYFNTALDNYLAWTNPTDTMTRVSNVTVNEHLLMPFLKDILNILLFFTPLITMRCFAEEKKLGTYDLLVSYPLKPSEILLGKYIGSVTIIFFLLAISLAYPVVVFFRGEPYLPPVFTTYIGYACFLLFYVAFGVTASIFTENQIVAAIITYLALLSAALIQWLAFISPAPWDQFFAHFLLLAHLETFQKGIIFVGDIVAYVSISVLILFLGYFKIQRHHTL